MTFRSADDLNPQLDRFLRRWAFVRAANMEAFAERTAAWLGCPGIPRLAPDVLPALSIDLAREPLPAGLAAVWSLNEGRYRIRLSPFLSGPRANFTLWHEWFEIMAARPAFPRAASRNTAGRHERLAERLADRFAACLTMPAGPLLGALQEFQRCGDKTDVLAARFGVTRTAMRRRLGEVRLYGRCR